MTKVFCALDTADHSQARIWAQNLADTGCGLKLGLEYFIAQGPEGVSEIRAVAPEAEIFLDLKLHDIPNTVAGAVRAAVHCQVNYLTLHASGGGEMMKAAVQAVQDEAAATGYDAPKILAVTVLTSLDQTALNDVGQQGQPAEQVVRLAALAAQAGVHGIVCSPHEIAAVRQAAPKLLLVVPGIRPAGSQTGDQKRVMTPPEAARLGADWLVIGRPITAASVPAQAARDILASLEKKTT